MRTEKVCVVNVVTDKMTVGSDATDKPSHSYPSDNPCHIAPFPVERRSKPPRAKRRAVSAHSWQQTKPEPTRRQSQPIRVSSDDEPSRYPPQPAKRQPRPDRTGRQSHPGLAKRRTVSSPPFSNDEPFPTVSTDKPSQLTPPHATNRTFPSQATLPAHLRFFLPD